MRIRGSAPDSGFTLIELMVACALLGVLIAIGFSSFSEFLAKSRLRGAADDLGSQAAHSRLQAMRMDRNVSMSMVSSGAVWCVGARQFELPSDSTVGLDLADGDAPACACDSAPETCVVAGDQSVVSSADFSNVEVTSAPADLQFDRKAGVLDDLTDKTFTLRSTDFPNDYSLSVEVSPLGNAHVCIPSGFVSFGGYRPC